MKNYQRTVLITGVLSAFALSAVVLAVWAPGAAKRNPDKAWEAVVLSLSVSSRCDLLISVNGIPADCLRFTDLPGSIAYFLPLKRYERAIGNRLVLRPTEGGALLSGRVMVVRCHGINGEPGASSSTLRVWKLHGAQGTGARRALIFRLPNRPSLLGVKRKFEHVASIGAPERQALKVATMHLFRAMRDRKLSEVPMIWKRSPKSMRGLDKFMAKAQVTRTRALTDLTVYRFRRGVIITSKYPKRPWLIKFVPAAKGGQKVLPSGFSYNINNIKIVKVGGKWRSLPPF